MKIKVGTAKKVLDRLSEATGLAQGFTDLREISEKIGLKNSNYLYMKVHQQIQNKSEKAMIGLNQSRLAQIAAYLGFKSFREFEASLTGEVSPQLTSLLGSYYCYVRANLLNESLVFRSPVRIFKKENKIWWELKGPSITYNGEVVLRHYCLFILMTSKEGKSFHHVYKIGNRSEPRVLQGVFSGVSTAFDPIGGRTVLVKQENAFGALTNHKASTSAMKKSKRLEDKVLALYFKEYYNNNVAPNKSGGFNLEDLK